MAPQFWGRVARRVETLVGCAGALAYLLKGVAALSETVEELRGAVAECRGALVSSLGEVGAVV